MAEDWATARSLTFFQTSAVRQGGGGGAGRVGGEGPRALHCHDVILMCRVLHFTYLDLRPPLFTANFLPP